MAPSTTTNEPKVWLITGCSSGLGRLIAIAARKRGDLVIATARKIETLDELKTLGCEALTLDVTSSDATVNDVVATAHAFYGRIDILVNNAGYATMGVVEEASTEDVQAVFDTNVFGLLRVTRAVLPYMREKKSGTIVNIGSGAGYVAFPIFGVYGATKFAVAGLTQSLRQEVAAFSIKVTTIEPSSFETSGFGGMKGFANQIAEYEPVKKAILEGMAGALVPGDAAKGAQAIVEAITQSGRCEGRELPNRLPLGAGNYELIQGVLDNAKKELDAWVDFTKAETFAKDT
ncbi:hypothetical protein Poli38472_007543 [Pythium oligandrum]|uniref:Uncharacterized protein n=1 Tax=Pythium oligandrum TaxID=41045 RepID=A0A8K1CSJ4_PYTOL|nr:hypothetical protein Poli38472_007542 [Pythium oligandrum]TMW67871.1 hypothetical protein Poli38472_007543 [Pythium oligandrum]|eukprot:TMW67870.1 hypothetical protein Poli38472_007542 [Pythium oligandrum]